MTRHRRPALRRGGGFSLIELIVTLVILAVAAATLAVSYRLAFGLVGEDRDAVRDTQQAQSVMEWLIWRKQYASGSLALDPYAFLQTVDDPDAWRTEDLPPDWNATGDDGWRVQPEDPAQCRYRLEVRWAGVRLATVVTDYDAYTTTGGSC